MKVRFLDNVLDCFYKDGYVEDDRLTSDKMHYIEFITTTHYIECINYSIYFLLNIIKFNIFLGHKNLIIISIN